MGRSRIRFRTMMVVLLFSSTVPLAVLSAWVLHSAWEHQIDLVDRQNIDRARAISVAVDQRVERTVAVLETLATARSMQQHDYPQVMHRVAELSEQHDWEDVVVTAPDGTVLAHTSLDRIGDAVEELAALSRAVAEIQARAVSPLIRDSSDGSHFVLVAVPVRQAVGIEPAQAPVTAVFAARIDARAIGRVLDEQSVPPGGVVTLLDQRRVIVARTQHPERYVGSLPAPGFQRAAWTMVEGTWEDVLLEGTQVFCALSRSPTTGWTLGVGLARSTVEAPIRRWFWTLIGVATVLLLAGLGVAFQFGRRIVARVDAVAAAARALARGEQVAAPRSRIVELDELSRALAEAAAVLHVRLRERDAAEVARADAALDRERALWSEREAQASLAREGARNVVTLRSIGDAVITTDAAGHVVDANRAALEMTAWSAEEIEDRRLHEALQLLDERTGEPFDLQASGVAAGTAIDDHVPLLLRARDGTTMPVEIRSAQLRTGEGPLLGVVLVLRDITERRAAELQRRELLQQEQEARQRAEAANRSKDEFLAMLAHELRNPLSPILHLAQVLARSGEPQVERAATVIDRQVRHMARLIEDLLDVARFTSGRIQLRRGEVVVAEALAQAVETVEPSVRRRRQELRFEPPPRDLVVDGDAERLAQVFGNLLHNAVKFTPEGGRIEIAAAREGDRVRIDVRDSGRGIERQHLDEVFEPFRQVEMQIDRAEGGLGIGLTLVKRLVEMHGGEVEASSAGIGHGSTFTVRLPLRAAMAATTPATANGAGAQATDRQRRVLVVDDNRDAADCTVLLLRLRGHEAQAAYDGPSALRAAATFAPDAVVLDIGLPGMDGYEVAAALRAQGPDGRGLRLIALSGYVEDAERSRQAGFDVHLTKPVREDALERALS